MSEVVNNYRETRTKKYPYQEWYETLLGLPPDDALLLNRGDDYHCQEISLANQIRSWARQEGHRINVFIENDHVILRLRRK